MQPHCRVARVPNAELDQKLLHLTFGIGGYRTNNEVLVSRQRHLAAAVAQCLGNRTQPGFELRSTLYVLDNPILDKQHVIPAVVSVGTMATPAKALNVRRELEGERRIEFKSDAALNFSTVPLETMVLQCVF